MDPLIHILVPSIILLALGIERKKVLIYSPMALLPDLMYFTQFHRNLSNSFVFFALVSAVLYLVLKKKGAAKICAFFLLSHVILDINGYSAIFYPILPHYFMLRADAVYNRFTGLNLSIGIDVRTEVAYVYDSYLLATNTFLFVLVLLIALFYVDRQKIIKYVWTRLRL